MRERVQSLSTDELVGMLAGAKAKLEKRENWAMMSNRARIALIGREMYLTGYWQGLNAKTPPEAQKGGK